MDITELLYVFFAKMSMEKEIINKKIIKIIKFYILM